MADDAPYRVRVDLSPLRVRVEHGGVAVADSRRALLLLEQRHAPVFYLPVEDVRMDLLEPTERRTRCPHKGEARYFTVTGGERPAENGAWVYDAPLAGVAAIKGRIAFYPDRLDWFEIVA